jgi:hypothetical protein
MPLLDNMRRWIKDQREHDEQITIRPSKSLDVIEQNLLEMNAAERNRSVEHIKAYADLYYQGRHNEAVPVEIRERVHNLETRAIRLNTVDAAREVVAKYGGPPTEATVQESLERSYKEREHDWSHSYAHVAKDSVVRPSASLAMDAAGSKEERTIGMGYHGA